MKYSSLLIGLIFFASCQGGGAEDQPAQANDTIATVPFDAEAAKAKYNAHQNFTPAEMDTLMTDLATYISARPSDAQWDTRFTPRFRQYYTENRNALELVYLHKSDSMYYYYLLRDAKDVNGIQKRGVAGQFKMDDSLTITAFEEILNTRIFEEDKLIEIGAQFMDEISANGNANTFLNDSLLVEWPDGTLFYSKQKQEWRFVE